MAGEGAGHCRRVRRGDDEVLAVALHAETVTLEDRGGALGGRDTTRTWAVDMLPRMSLTRPSASSEPCPMIDTVSATCSTSLEEVAS